jgi:hypothetical protein
VGRLLSFENILQSADAVHGSGRQTDERAIASAHPALLSHRPQTHLETSCTRTGSQWLSEAVHKHSFLWATVAHKGLKHAGSPGPKRTASDLIAFPEKANGTRASPREITDCHLRGFVYPSTGVVT